MIAARRYISEFKITQAKLWSCAELGKQMSSSESWKKYRETTENYREKRAIQKNLQKSKWESLQS